MFLFATPTPAHTFWAYLFFKPEQEGYVTKSLGKHNEYILILPLVGDL
jgi:hypothetical protein